PPPVGRFITQPMESESVITDGQWHHIGFVWDGSYRILYVDGTEVAKDTNPITLSPLIFADGGLYFGTSNTLDAGTFFSGLIDDVRIYNIALSSEKIEALAR
ncbi:MAG: LamG domain-containing protein, partial [candidate division Zixibacteria bacterium]